MLGFHGLGKGAGRPGAGAGEGGGFMQDLRCAWRGGRAERGKDGPRGLGGLGERYGKAGVWEVPLVPHLESESRSTGG